MKRLLLIAAVCLVPLVCKPGLAQEKATAREAYEKVAAAAAYLAKAGEDGIASLGDPDKQFIWKDSYVWVARCESNSCFPNPRARAARLLISEAKCFKTGKLYILDLCDRVEDPNGAWTIFYRQDPETKAVQRQVAYMRQVPGQTFQVVASVGDETISMSGLEKISTK